MNQLSLRAKKYQALYREKLGHLEKTAINPFGFVASHVAQNAALNKALKNRRFADYISRFFKSGVTGEKASLVDRMGKGFVGGSVMPEVSYLATSAEQSGNILRNAMRSKGLNQLDPNTIKAMDDLLSGNASDLVALAKSNPIAKNTLDQVLSPYNMNADNVVNYYQLVASSGKSNPLIENILGNLMSSFRGAKAPVNIGNTIDDVIPKASFAERASNIAGYGAMGVVDPITAAVNVGKNVVSNPRSRRFMQNNKYLSKTLDKADDVLVRNRMNKAFNKGQQGGSRGAVDKAVTTYGLNPLTNYMIEGANTAGKLGIK